MRSSIRVLALPAFAALGAGCGGGDQTAAKPRAATPAAPASVIELVAPMTPGDEPLRFDQRRLRADAGLVELRLRNDDSRVHNVRIQRGDTCCDPANDVGGTDTIDDGTSTTARVRLEAGTYWFLCSVNNHYTGELGKMKGRLVVE